MKPIRSWAAVLLGIVAACSSGAVPAVSPTVPGTPSPSASGTAPAPPSTTPKPRTSPPPTASPVPGQGLAWNAIALPTPQTAESARLDLTGIAAGPQGWLAIAMSLRSNDGVAWISRDGSTWMTVEGAVWLNGRPMKSTWWKERWVVVGVTEQSAEAHLAVWSSEDGETWQRATDRDGFAFVQGPQMKQYIGDRGVPYVSVRTVYIDGDRLVAEGFVAVACDCDTPPPLERWTTKDGIDWQFEVAEPAVFQVGPIETDLGRFKSDGSSIERSADGNTWLTVWKPSFVRGSEREIWGMTSFGGGVLAVGRISSGDSYQTALVLSTATGAKWVESTGWPDLALGYMTGVASYDNGVVAIGRGGASPADFDELRNPLRPYVWVLAGH